MVTNDIQSNQPTSYRLERAAGVLGLHIDDLLQLARDGCVLLCIKGGGRSFSSFAEVPGEKPGEFMIRPQGVVQVHEDMYLDSGELSAILALGRTRLNSLLTDCENPKRMFLPSGGFGRLSVSLDDLWIRSADMPQRPAAAAANGSASESVVQRQNRRLGLWQKDFEGNVHKVRDKWVLKAPKGKFKEFVDHLATHKEKAVTSKSVRLDLITAAQFAQTKGTSIFRQHGQ